MKKKELPKLEKKEEALFKIEVTPELPVFQDVPKDQIDVKYPLIAPYSYAHIKWDPQSKSLTYNIQEPELDIREKHILNILEDGIKELINISYLNAQKGETLIAYLEKNLQVLLTELRIKITKESYFKLMYYIYRDFVGLGKIEPLMNDYFIEDIECNGSNLPIFIVHRKFRNLKTNVLFETNKELATFVERLAQKAGQYISYASPLLNGSLPDGSRVNATYTEDVSSRGPTFCFKEGYVQLGNGEVKKIQELFDESKNNFGSNIEEGNEITKPLNMTILGVDANTLEQKNCTLKSVIKLPAPKKLVKIELNDGAEVEVTLNHKFHVAEDELRILEAKDIKRDMLIPIPSSVKSQGYRQKINVYTLLKDFSYSNKICLASNVEIKNLVSDEIQINTINNIYRTQLSQKYGVSNSYFYEILSRGNSISFTVLDELCKNKNTNFENLGDIHLCVYGGGTKNKSKLIKVPNEVDEDLAYLAGAVISDGHLHKKYIDISANEEGFNSATKEKLLNEFGKFESYYDDQRVYLCNVFIPYYFNKVFGIPIGNKTKIVKIPEIIFKSDNKAVAQFIKGLFDGDGTCNSGLSYKTYSKRLAEELTYLLARLGIYSYIKHNKDENKVNIPSPYYKKFKELIGFYSLHKKEKLESLIDNQVDHKTLIYHLRIPTAPFIKILEKIQINKSELLRLAKLNKAMYNRFYYSTISKTFAKKLYETLKNHRKSFLIKNELEYIFWLIESRQEYIKVKRVEVIENQDNVYDIELEPCTFFVAGNKPLNMFDTIRKFTKKPWTPTQLINLGTVSPEILAYLWLLIEYEKNIMVIGGTASGKTTILNGITFFIPPEARIVSIEDTRELNLEHSNWLPSVAREGVGLANLVGQKYGEVSLFNLLKESFRQRPDYVIVGEIRGEEAYVLFQGMASGHASLGTMHATDIDTLIKRLETPPINLSSSLVETMDAVCVMTQTKIAGKPVRRLREIFEVIQVSEEGGSQTNTPFLWDARNDTFIYQARSYVFQQIVQQQGIPEQQLISELNRRSKLLKKMVEIQVYDFIEVQNVINEYNKDPDLVLSKFGILR